MTSRERVRAVLRGEPTDRVPLNVFAGWNPGVRARVEAAHGSVAAFEARHHIDVVTGVMPRFPFGPENDPDRQDLDRYLGLDPVDPRDPALLDEACDAPLNLFRSVREALAFHDEGRAVFAHVWGVFELSQFLFERDGLPGTETALLNLIAEPEKTAALFDKLSAWTAACVESAAEAGVDAIELSDDWGQQRTLLFSPRLWHRLVQPATQRIVDAARRHGVPVILHSDGDVTKILDGIRQLGVSGLHPVQESAGMSFEATRAALGPDVCIVGGLDTVSALPVMDEAAIRDEVARIFAALKPTGPFLFSGSHMFQDDAPLSVIEAAYDAAYELARF